MKIRMALTVFVAVFSGALRADFGYQSATQVTGGVKKPAVSTQLIKGHRMTSFNKQHATVVNLDNDTILEIDYAEKTFFSRTVAQMKESLDGVKKDRAGAAFQVSAKSGSTKEIGVLSARERMFTMTSQDANPVAHVFLDCWTMTLPGFEEVQDFRRRLAAKLGYAYALGLSEIGAAKPELLPGFEGLAKVIIEADQMPVDITIRMGGPESGDLAPSGGADSQKSGLVAGTLGRLESLGRKKNRDDDPDTKYPGLLAEITIELGNFSPLPRMRPSLTSRPGLRK